MVNILRVVSCCFLIGFSTFFAQVVADENSTLATKGNYFVNSYDLTAVGGDARNYAMVSDPKGRIYLANNSGIFIYDGSIWRMLVQSAGLTTRALALDGERLIVGTRGDFGYFQLDQVSGLAVSEFQSMLSILPQGAQSVGVIKDIFIRSEGVYFRSSEAIYFLDNDQELHVIGAQGARFHRMFVVHDKLIIQKRRVGLYELNNGQVSVFVQGQFFADKTIYSILAYQQAYLFFTADQGIFIYDGADIVPFNLDANVTDLLANNNIYLAQWLENGILALAITGEQQGLMLINEQGQLIRLVGGSDGLSDTLINAMLEDHQGGLWLSLVNGLDRVEVSSNLSYFDSRHGLTGYLYTAARHLGEFYVATSRGVFHLYQGEYNKPEFKQVAGINEACYSLLPSKHGLLVACDGNLYRIDADQAGHIAESIHNIYALVDASLNEAKPKVLVGHADKLGLLEYIDHQWRYRSLYDIAAVSLVSAGSGVFWLRHQLQGVVRVDYSQGFEFPPILTHFDRRHGLPAGEIHPSNIDGEVKFNTDTGLYRLAVVEPISQSRFVPDLSFGDLSGRNVYLSQNVSNRVQFIERFKPTSEFGIRNAVMAIAQKDQQGRYELNFTDHARMSAYPLLNIILDLDGSIWVLSDGRLLRMGGQSYQKVMLQPFVSGISVLGSKKQRLKRSSQPLIMEYTDNSLRFDFAFTGFDEQKANRFSYQLDGFDKSWSDWSKQTFKEYTQINEGNYRFKLRAKDVYGDVFVSEAIYVKILPPWYRTWWAYLLYISLVLFLLIFIAKSRTKQLVERAKALEVVIEQRTKTIREGSLVIEQQKQAIENLLEQKNDLFANISHEFRTPLTLILGPANQLLKSKVDSEQHHHLQLIKQNSFRLLRMVNQILTLAKLSAIPHQQKVSLSLKSHVDFMIASFKPLANDKQIELNVLPYEDVRLFMVSDALEKILLNLLSNAVKYTAENGSIELKIKQFKPEWISIRVADSGYGIPAEQVARVFERFKRVDHPEHTKVQGTGLGLSMVKDLVEAHDGKIYLHSELGKGSVFTVELPLSKEQVVSNEVVVAPQLANLDMDIELQTLDVNSEEGISDRAVEFQQALNSNENNLSGEAKLSLLVIEDTKQMREFVVSLFARRFVVYSAQDGEEGVTLAKEHLPDLIISDVMMPHKDGYQVCSELKADQATCHIPIILLTAKNDLESRMQGWKEQADEYLAKPFDDQELQLRVSNLLAIRQTLKQRFGRLLHEKPQALSEANEDFNEKDQKFLQRFTVVIEKYYAQGDFNLPMAASEMYVSERLLQKKLKVLIDHTFTEYLRTYRLNKAAQMLKEGAKASDAADACGFSSQAYFSRCFKAEFGQTATQYIQKDNS